MEGLLPLSGHTLPPPAYSGAIRHAGILPRPVPKRPPPEDLPDPSKPNPWSLDSQALIAQIREARWPAGPICPKCQSVVVIRFGRRNGVQRYRCKDCFRCFNDLTGTVLQGIRHRDRWLDFNSCMVRGLTVRKAAAEVGISKNTSFAWRHRIIANLAASDSQITLAGIVELCQRKIIVSHKGSGPPRHDPPGITPNIKRQWSRNILSPMAPPSRIAFLLLAVDRTGKARAQLLSRTDGPGFSPVVRELAASVATICVERGQGLWPKPCDKTPRLTWVGRTRGRISPVDEDAEGPLYHTHNVKHLMREYNRWEMRFHGVATKYLLRYVAWFWRVYSLDTVREDAAAKKLLFAALHADQIEVG